MIDSEPFLSWQGSFHPMYRLAASFSGSFNGIPVFDSGQRVFLTSEALSQFKKFTPACK
jgi:uncharacterized protein YigE (DUF2233 family)